MAQTSWPFENIDTTETQFSQWARNINEGIKQGTGSELAVTAPGGGMTIQVASGQAMIRGHYYSNTATETFTIAAANPSNPRIDAVVLELDPSANTVILKVLAGTPAGSPVAPSLTQTDSGIYQLRLANVLVEAATLSIESGDITDLRQYMYAGVGKWTTAARPTNPVENETLGFNTDLDQHEYWNGSAWVPFTPTDSISVDILEATGDIIYASAAETPERLAIGAAGTVLVSDGTVPTWDTFPAPSSVVQVSGSKTLSAVAGQYQASFSRDTGGTFYVNGTVITSSTNPTLGAELSGPWGLALSTSNTIEFYSSYVLTTSNIGIGNTGPGDFDGTNYAVYGTSNAVGLSTDKTTWTGITPINFTSARNGLFANGLYVAIDNTSNGTTPRLRTSTDAITWNNITVTGTSTFTTVNYANGLWVVTNARDNENHVSTDGITWTGAIDTRVSPRAITYGTLWLVHNSFNSGATSTNGTTWTNYSLTTAISTNNVIAATFGNSLYVLGGVGGVLTTATTPGATGWTSRSSGTANDITGLAYGAGVYVYAANGGVIRSSTNGITWTARTSGTANNILSMDFVNNIFIAKTNSEIITSTNGTTWTATETGIALSGFSSIVTTTQQISWDGTRYFTISNNANGDPMFSTDGVSWGHYGPQTTYNSLRYQNNLWIAGLATGRIQTSTDGLYWYTRRLPIDGNVTSSIYISSLGYWLVGASAVGGSGGVGISTNSTSWTSVTPNTTGDVNGFIWDGTRVVYHSPAQLGESTNLISWSPIFPTGISGLGTTALITGLAFGAGAYVLHTSDGKIYRSTDRTAWTEVGATNYTAEKNDNVYFVNNEFVIVGQSLLVWFSPDGITWRYRVNNSGNNITDLIDDGSNHAIVTGTALWSSQANGNATVYLVNHGNVTVL